MKALEFGEPATYRVVGEGRLDEDLSNLLAGMRVTTKDRGERPPEITLVGHFQDQAELAGLLDMLQGRHLSILLVERVDDEA
jgi:hypothetical protein